jgi:uncharacterized membrane protein (DUF106 family)
MFKINIDKLKENHKNALRAGRYLKFQQLDIEYMKALENNDTENLERIREEKQKLRDITSDETFLNSNTFEEVISYWPDFLEAPYPYKN